MSYSIAPIDGVQPLLAESFLRQQMAIHYQKAVPDLSDEEARDAATATWETDWDEDPEPRTLKSAIDAVNSDLEYWHED